MPRAPKTPVDPDDAPLKRLGGGRWQSRDERFTIEPQSGTWVIVDGEQTDDFGLALVRGPFPSLTAVREAIAGARSTAPATSPLADRIERRRDEPSSAARAPTRAREPKERTRAGSSRRDSSGHAAPENRAQRLANAAPAEEKKEPGWLADLAPTERGRARRLIARLGQDGVPDAEGLVRRDLVGDVPALAAHAIGARLAELGAEAKSADLADLLADGRDEALGVRWRLVDGDGRPILLDRGTTHRR